MEHKKFAVAMGGSGGQGILTIGKLLAEAGMSRYEHVVFFSSYGAAMRGGESTCVVTLSDEEIGALAPFNPPAALVLTPLTLADLEKRMPPGGTLFMDSSALAGKLSRDDLKVYNIPATERARGLGDVRAASFVLLGAYLEATKAVPLEDIEKALEKKMASGKGQEVVSINKKALREGARLVANYINGAQG